jgi:alanine racemase
VLFLKRTWAEINLDNIEYNYKSIKNAIRNDCKIMSIIKADAYGHGAVYLAQKLIECGAEYFGVSNLEEALQLRHAGVSQDILILGYTPPEYAEELSKNHITQTIFSEEYAVRLSNSLADTSNPLKIHIKVDTGMARLGFTCFNDKMEQDSAAAIQNICKMKGLVAEGIFTHFARSDEPENNFTQLQFNRFMSLISLLENKGVPFKLKHCCNSAAIINFPQMQLDMVRPGIILYGLYPDGKKTEKIDLKPVMQLKTVISQIKHLEMEIPVSYGGIWTSSTTTSIATMPIGYADGFPRILSNNYQILVNGKRANIIGRVCMDQCLADISNIENVTEGQTVTIFGEENNEFIPIEEIAEITNTINYEVACLIGKRVPRFFFCKGQEIGELNYLLL